MPREIGPPVEHPALVYTSPPPGETVQRTFSLGCCCEVRLFDRNNKPGFQNCCLLFPRCSSETQTSLCLSQTHMAALPHRSQVIAGGVFVFFPPRGSDYITVRRNHISEEGGNKRGWWKIKERGMEDLSKRSQPAKKTASLSAFVIKYEFTVSQVIISQTQELNEFDASA